MNSGSTPGTSYELHANTSTFYIRNSNISILSQPSMLDPIWKYLSVSGNILTLISSSTQPAPSSPRGFCNCYNGASSAVSLCLACLSFQLTATTGHCRATCWFPLMVVTPYSKLNLHMQGGRNGPHRVNPRPSQNPRVKRKQIDHYELHHHFLAFHTHGKRNLALRNHHPPVKRD